MPHCESTAAYVKTIDIQIKIFYSANHAALITCQPGRFNQQIIDWHFAKSTENLNHQNKGYRVRRLMMAKIF